MPTLTKPKHIDALAAEVATRTGNATEIAGDLNASTETGTRIGALTPQQTIEALSAEAYASIEEAALAGNADAYRFIAYLSYGTELGMDTGEGPRVAAEALVSAGAISQSAVEALIEAATEADMSGPSWGEQIGIGHIYPEFIGQVRQ